MAATMTFNTTQNAVNIVLTLESGREIKGQVSLKADGTPVVWDYPYKVQRWANAQCDKLSGNMTPMGIDKAIHGAIFNHKPLTLIIDRTQAINNRVRVQR